MAPRKAQPLRRSDRIKSAGVPASLAAPLSHNNRVAKSKPAPQSKAKAQKYDCTTCGLTLASSAFPNLLPTADCDHLINTCKSCLKNWVATQLDNTIYNKLSCPECPEILQNGDVKAYATKSVYAKFDELEKRGNAEKTPGWRWCLAPGCKAGQVHQTLAEISPNAITSTRRKGKARAKAVADEDICACHKCGAKACVPCDKPWHEGETCAQYQKRVNNKEKDEKASVKTIEKKCKKCPNCDINIQRDGGCDHMICKCFTSPCWPLVDQRF